MRRYVISESLHHGGAGSLLPMMYSFIVPLPRRQPADDLVDALANGAVTESCPSIQMPGSLFSDGDLDGHETFVIVLLVLLAHPVPLHS